MRWKEIFEAPISDFQTFGDMTTAGSFRDDDLRAIRNPKWVEKVHRYFRKVKQNINLYIYNDPTEKLRSYASIADNGGFREWYEVAKYIGYKGTDTKRPDNWKDSITIILVENEGSERVPLSPWMVAHRISHALTSDGNRDDTIQIAVSEVFSKMNAFVDNLAEVLRASGKYDLTNNRFNPYSMGRTNIVGELAKFNSVKKGRMVRPGEFYHEMIAQYLIQGSITFNRVKLDDKPDFHPREIPPEQVDLLRIARGSDLYRNLDDSYILRYATRFAKSVLLANDKNRESDWKWRQEPREPQFYYDMYNDAGELMAQCSQGVSEDTLDEYRARGYTVKKIMPTKSEITRYNNYLKRKQTLINLYTEWYHEGILFHDYLKNNQSFTQRANIIMDTFEAEVNPLVEKMLELCVGRVIVL